MNPKEVVNYIEGEPYISVVSVDSGMTNVKKKKGEERAKSGKELEGDTKTTEQIVGLNTENSEINEGIIRFDIIFYVRTEEHIGFAPTIALISGCLSVLAGLMLLVYPGAVKWAFSLFFPMWFIAHCISRLSQLPMIRIWTVKWHYYFIMIANIIGLCLGIFMLIRPVAALISLSYLIGIDLILLGIDSIILAFSRMGSDW